MNQENEEWDDISCVNAKRIRKQKRISLQELSGRTGISVAYLSKYENGRANITIVTLKKIADALGVTIADLLTEDENFSFLTVRASERYKLVHHDGSNGPAYEEFITKGKSYNMTVVVMTLPEGDLTAEEASLTYSEDCIFVLQGKLGVMHGDKEVVLSEGDSVYYDARAVHNWKNVGEGAVKFLLAQYPPSF